MAFYEITRLRFAQSEFSYVSNAEIKFDSPSDYSQVTTFEYTSTAEITISTGTSYSLYIDSQLAISTKPFDFYLEADATILVTTERFVRDPFIAIGHSNEDASIIYNGDFIEFSAIVTVGSPTELFISGSDTLLGDDEVEEGEFFDATDTLGMTDEHLSYTNPPPEEYSDTLSMADSYDHFAGVDFEATDTLTGSDYIQDVTIEYFNYDTLLLDDVVDYPLNWHDTLTMADRSGASIHEERSDTINMADFFDEGLVENPTDIIYISDQAHKQAEFDPYDEIGFYDYYTKGLVVDPYDEIGFYDYYNEGEVSDLSDTIDMTDSADVNLEEGAAYEDSLGMTDYVDINEESTYIFDETLEISDEWMYWDPYYQVPFRQYDENLDISDRFGEGEVFYGTDTIDVDDFFTAIVDLYDTISMTDSYGTESEYINEDTIDISDEWFSNDYTISFDDTIGISDRAGKGVYANPSDTISMTDEISEGIVQDLSDTIDLSDDFSRDAVLTDILSATDSVLLEFRIGLSDTISMTDSFAFGGTFTKDYDDSLDISDEVQKGEFFEISDTVDIVDEFISLIELSDSISITDYTQDVEIEAFKTDTLSFEDSASFGGIWSRDYYDTVEISDQAERDQLRIESDALEIQDKISTIVQLSDTLSADDSYDIPNYEVIKTDTLTGEDFYDVPEFGISTIDYLTMSDEIQEGEYFEWTDELDIVDVVQKQVESEQTDYIIMTDELLQIYFFGDSISMTDSFDYDPTWGFVDTLSATDVFDFGGEFLVRITETLILGETVDLGLPYDVDDTLTFYDEISNVIELEDTLTGDDVVDVFSREFIGTDTLDMSEELSIGGSLTTYTTDSISMTDEVNRGAEKDASDTISITDTFEVLKSLSDTLSFSDSIDIDFTKIKSYSDTIDILDVLDFGGTFTKDYYDTLDFEAIVRRGLVISPSDTIILAEFFEKGQVQDVDESVNISDKVGLGFPQIFSDDLIITDTYEYFKLSWVSLYDDDFEYKPAITSFFIYSDDFEVTKPLTSVLFLFIDDFEWWEPYRTIVWSSVLLFRDRFEIIVPIWQFLYDDDFEYKPDITWTPFYSDSFEEYPAYRDVQLTLFLYKDDFEYLPELTDIFLFEDPFEVEPVQWVLLYVEVDPVNPVVWVEPFFYDDDFEVSFIVIWDYFYTDGFEVSYTVVWDYFYTDDFEVSLPVVVWLYYYSDAFDWLSEIAPVWNFFYLEDFEPIPTLVNSIIAGIEKTNKRWDTNSVSAYGNLVDYDPSDPYGYVPKYDFILNNLIIGVKDRVLNTNVQADALAIEILETEVVIAEGAIQQLIWNEIRTYGQGIHKLTTYINWTKYLFAFINTEIAAATVTSTYYNVLINAPRKEITTEFIPAEVSGNRPAVLLWDTNILTTGNEDIASRLDIEIDTIKDVVEFIDTVVWAGVSITLAIQLNNNIVTSYSAAAVIVETELSAPIKDVGLALPTNINIAYPLYKILESNVEISYGTVLLLETLIQTREGDAAVPMDVNLQGIATNVNRRWYTEIETSQGITQKPWMYTYIGGPAELPFYKDVAEVLPTNIGPLVIEWYWQYGPGNTRRPTNIIAGDVGIPFVKTHKLESNIQTITIVEEKLATNIYVNFDEDTIVNCYTSIWALRCPTCLITEIQVEHRREVDTNVWIAYGEGSVDYIEYILSINVTALRVPQAVLPTNIELGDKETFVVGYSPQIHAWFGPEVTGTIAIYQTPLLGWKNVVNLMDVHINVGEEAFAVQTESNISTIRGAYIWYRTNIAAPYAIRWEYYPTQIIAGFISDLKLNTNIWGGHPDDKRMWFGVWEYLNTNILTEKTTLEIGYSMLISAIAEHAYIFGSCGIAKIMDITTSVWAAKTNLDPIMYTTFDLVDIASYAEISDSILVLSEIVDSFDNFVSTYVEHDLFKAENFELYVNFRFRYSIKFFENVEVFPRHIWLNFKKIVKPEEEFEIPTREIADSFADDFEDAQVLGVEIINVSNNFDDEFEITIYVDTYGDEYIDILIIDTLDITEEILPSLIDVVLDDTLEGDDFYEV